VIPIGLQCPVLLNRVAAVGLQDPGGDADKVPQPIEGAVTQAARVYIEDSLPSLGCPVSALQIVPEGVCCASVSRVKLTYEDLVKGLAAVVIAWEGQMIDDASVV
jgi:hypothetical protein